MRSPRSIVEIYIETIGDNIHFNRFFVASRLQLIVSEMDVGLTLV